MNDNITYTVDFENEYGRSFERGIDTDYAHIMTAMCKDSEGTKFCLSYTVFTAFPDTFQAMLALHEKIRKQGDKVLYITYHEMLFI